MLGWQLQIQSKQKLKQLLVILIGPLVVVGILLWAFWQPAVRQDLLQVAVINQDNAVKVNGKAQTFGTTLLTALQKSQTLTFKQTNAKQAKQGLANGQYAAVVTMPANFSQSIQTYAKKGKSATVQVAFNSAQSPAQTQLAKKAIDQAIYNLNSQLLSTSTNSSTLEKSAKTSSDLSQIAKTLLGSVQSVNGQVPSAQTLQGIADDTSSYGTDLANLVSQLNTAITNDDQTQVSALAVKIQTIGYELQTSHQSAVNTLIAALSTIDSYTDAQSPLQQNAKALQDNNGSLASALTGTASELTPKGTTAVITVAQHDTLPTQTLGAQMLPALIVAVLAGVALLALVRYDVRVTDWQTQHVLEQWWGHFQVLGALSALSAIGMLGLGAAFGWRGDWLWSVIAVVLYGWFAISLVWLSKVLLGKGGLLLSVVLFLADLLLSNAWYPAALFGQIAQAIATILPANQTVLALRGLEPQQHVGVLVIWIIGLTAVLLTVYRAEQKGHRVALVR